MRRRELLIGGAAAAGLSALEGCAPARPPTAPLEPGEMPQDMSAFVRRVDANLASMESSDFVRGFAADAAEGPLSDAQRAALEPKEKLFRGMLRTLYVTQTFRDLPPEAQQHPEMQECMHRHIEEVDRTVTNVSDMLGSLDDEQRTRLQKHLRARPDLGMRVAEEVDAHAAKAGVSNKRRFQLRSMMAQTTFRLKHASPGALIDEYVEKVQRVKAQDGLQSELALRAAGQASRDMFWKDAAAPPDPSGEPRAAAPAPPLPDPKKVRPPRAYDSSHPGSGKVKTGAILMGIGVATGALSGALVAAGGGAAIAGVVGLTIGGLLFAIGLIVLIVGALIYALSDPPPPPPPDEEPEAMLTW